jgi:hypothetical protein
MTCTAVARDVSQKSAPSAFPAGALLAGGLSLITLAARGQREIGAPAAPVNAVSHWLWADEALRRDGASASHTLLGSVIHMASGCVWAGLYDALLRSHDAPNRVDAVTDAVAVTAVAALVDLECTPDRLTPGFEHRLSRRGLFWVYGAFATGLAVAGLQSVKRRGKEEG